MKTLLGFLLILLALCSLDKLLDQLEASPTRLSPSGQQAGS